MDALDEAKEEQGKGGDGTSVGGGMAVAGEGRCKSRRRQCWPSQDFGEGAELRRGGK